MTELHLTAVPGKKMHISRADRIDLRNGRDRTILRDGDEQKLQRQRRRLPSKRVSER